MHVAMRGHSDMHITTYANAHAHARSHLTLERLRHNHERGRSVAQVAQDLTTTTSHHITPHHTFTNHTTPHHITSHHITSHHPTSCHCTSHHITSQHITPHHTTPHHITSLRTRHLHRGRVRFALLVRVVVRLLHNGYAHVEWLREMHTLAHTPPPVPLRSRVAPTCERAHDDVSGWSRTTPTHTHTHAMPQLTTCSLITQRCAKRAPPHAHTPPRAIGSRRPPTAVSRRRWAKAADLRHVMRE